MDGLIYFVQRSDGDIKIGKTLTSQFDTRMRSLTRQYGQLCILGVVDGYSEREKELHAQFASIRRSVKRRRRWHLCEFFEPSVELLYFIKVNARPMELKPPQKRVYPDEKTSGRVPITPSTQRRLKDFSAGLGGSFDDVLSMLLDRITREGESEFEAGRRLQKEIA